MKEQIKKDKISDVKDTITNAFHNTSTFQKLKKLDNEKNFFGFWDFLFFLKKFFNFKIFLKFF